MRNQLDEALIRMLRKMLVLQHHFGIGDFEVLRHTGSMVNRAGQFPEKNNRTSHHPTDKQIRER